MCWDTLVLHKSFVVVYSCQLYKDTYYSSTERPPRYYLLQSVDFSNQSKSEGPLESAHLRHCSLLNDFVWLT
jgi:hypothetical protein